MPPMIDLKGQRVVVTGGSSGIGLEITRRLCSQGAEVCVVARQSEALDAAASSTGAWGFRCDVGDEQRVKALGIAVRDRWGALDGLVNNAGIAPMGDLEHTDSRLWDECFRINTRGPFLVTRVLLPLLRRGEGASVVNISSTLAKKAIPGMVAYNASKAALNQMTRSLALELAPEIRVNAIMPAVIDTPIHGGRGMSSEDVRSMGSIHPMGRVGTPGDVAAMTLFLLSGEASWITGAIIPVDGGMTAG